MHLQPFPKCKFISSIRSLSTFLSFSLSLLLHFRVLVYFCGIPIDFLICASIKENLRCKFALSPRPDVRISFCFSYLTYGCAQYFLLCRQQKKKSCQFVASVQLTWPKVKPGYEHANKPNIYQQILLPHL